MENWIFDQSFKACAQTMLTVCFAFAVFYLVVFQHGFETSIFLAQLPDEADVCVLINGGFVDDLLGSVGVA